MCVREDVGVGGGRERIERELPGQNKVGAV